MHMTMIIIVDNEGAHRICDGSCWCFTAGAT
jgi:hypothetical protein